MEGKQQGASCMGASGPACVWVWRLPGSVVRQGTTSGLQGREGALLPEERQDRGQTAASRAGPIIREKRRSGSRGCEPRGRGNSLLRWLRLMGTRSTERSRRDASGRHHRPQGPSSWKHARSATMHSPTEGGRGRPSRTPATNPRTPGSNRDAANLGALGLGVLCTECALA